MDSLEGCFLVASPYLADGNFFRSVVYMIRHNDEGAFGVVINRPGDVDLADALGDSLGHAPQRNEAIHWGGPCEGPLLVLHRLTGLGEPCGIAGESEEEASVWVTTDEDHLRLLADRCDVPARFVAHYSGWGAGQLEAEVRAGGWLQAEVRVKELFGDSEPLWEQLVRRQGREVLGHLVPGDDGDFDATKN